MKNRKLGFTLTELLTVVLIVAILTSIALPQYRKSIRRAEAMESLVNLRSLYNAARRYKAATSAAPTSLTGLDVEFFDAAPIESGFKIGKFSYEFNASYIRSCRLNNGGFCFYFYYNHPSLGKDALICEPQNNSPTGTWICESLGTLTNGNYVLE